ncbi:hypothetical protein LQK80_14205 [Bacillus thuringiensis]|nr:hypothetical protein [Bacillus thuringiensis]
MTALQSTFYKNQKETDHFIFYSSKADYSEVVKLADNLEQHYGRIIGLLKTEPTTKTKVTVFQIKSIWYIRWGYFLIFGH